MSKSSFASLIIQKLEGAITKDGSGYNSGTPSAANSAIAQGITEYLLANVKISVMFSGMIPGTPPVPDICSDVVPVQGQCAPPTGTDFESWVKSIETNVVSGFFFAPGMAGVTPLGMLPAFMPGLQLTQGDIKSAHEGNWDDPQQPVWEVICEKIMNWLTISTTPTYAASHIAPSGVSTWVSTIVT